MASESPKRYIFLFPSSPFLSSFLFSLPPFQSWCFFIENLKHTQKWREKENDLRAPITRASFYFIIDIVTPILCILKLMSDIISPITISKWRIISKTKMLSPHLTLIFYLNSLIFKTHLFRKQFGQMHQEHIHTLWPSNFPSIFLPNCQKKKLFCRFIKEKYTIGNNLNSNNSNCIMFLQGYWQSLRLIGNVFS